MGCVNTVEETEHRELVYCWEQPPLPECGQNEGDGGLQEDHDSIELHHHPEGRGGGGEELQVLQHSP